MSAQKLPSFADFITVAANLDDCIAANNRAAIGAPDDDPPAPYRDYFDYREKVGAPSDAAYRQARAARDARMKP